MDYIGHPHQIRGAEQIKTVGGKADGMNFLIVRNGLGLELWISLDRCADVMRVTYKGNNMGFMSPCGIVAPTYYDRIGLGFLKSFTAGFFTTAGLTAVGSPCVDDGEELPLHGTVSHIPAELDGIEETENGITVKTTVRDCVIFGVKLILKRNYTVSFSENTFSVNDTVINDGDTAAPFMILYHCNMGYPLLTENSEVVIPNDGITPRNSHSAKFTDSALIMEKPQAQYEERCYYYDVKAENDIAKVGIFNKEINCGLIMEYDKSKLPFFTEWKMMGKKDYVLGLEPGNCTPDGRDVMRKENRLKFIDPDCRENTSVTFRFTDDCDLFEKKLL